MRPVMQTEFESGRGNALQACIASIFEEPMVSVPDFIRSDNYILALNEWLLPREIRFQKFPLESGLLPEELPLKPVLDPSAIAGAESAVGHSQDVALCLLAGQSPRGKHRHVVVAGYGRDTGFLTFHDPYPGGSGLDGLPFWAGFFFPITA